MRKEETRGKRDKKKPFRVFTHRWALASVAVYFHRLDKFIDTLLLAKFDFYVLLHLANEMLSDFEYHVIIDSFIHFDQSISSGSYDHMPSSSTHSRTTSSVNAKRNCGKG